MMRFAVPAFDLLPASVRRRRRSGPAAWRPMLVALGAGWACGLLILAEGQRRLEDDRESLVPLKSELEGLQARQRELAPKLQAQQALEAQQQVHALQRSRWQGASHLLQRLAQAPGPSARLQLTELRLDEQGLLLTGQIASSEFQAWMAGLQLPGGPAQLLELSPPSAPGEIPDGQPEMSRFVLRFSPSSAPSGGRP
jgi:Tfp pilus assembly protein PilN